MADTTDGDIRMPILEKEGAALLAEAKNSDLNKGYALRLQYVGESWCNNPTAPPIQANVELGNDTLAMTAYAAHGVCTTKPLDDIPNAHKNNFEYSCAYDFPIPSDSPLKNHQYGKADTIEELLGVHEKNKTKASTSVVTQTDVVSIQNIKETLSNSA